MMSATASLEIEVLELPLPSIGVYKRHPLLLQIIEMTQAELLEPEQDHVLQAIWRFFDGCSTLWPPAASPELRQALEGLQMLHKRYALDDVHRLLLHRKNQMRRRIGACLLNPSK